MPSNLIPAPSCPASWSRHNSAVQSIHARRPHTARVASMAEEAGYQAFTACGRHGRIWGDVVDVGLADGDDMDTTSETPTSTAPRCMAVASLAHQHRRQPNNQLPHVAIPQRRVIPRTDTTVTGTQPLSHHSLKQKTKTVPQRDTCQFDLSEIAAPPQGTRWESPGTAELPAPLARFSYAGRKVGRRDRRYSGGNTGNPLAGATY